MRSHALQVPQEQRCRQNLSSESLNLSTTP
jgi:hypothetical protein